MADFFFFSPQEGMLKSLQSSVESEESEWKQKLERSESDLEDLKRKNSALEESLKVVRQAEEVKNKEEEEEEEDEK